MLVAQTFEKYVILYESKTDDVRNIEDREFEKYVILYESKTCTLSCCVRAEFEKM